MYFRLYVKILNTFETVFILSTSLIEQGLTLHQHSIGYPGDSFTGQKTQPTASEY